MRLGWGSWIAIGSLGVILLSATIAKATERKPARDMTIAEALDTMRQYAANGVVTILSEGSGSMPKMIVGPVIAGVHHVYLDASGETPRGQIDNLDPRFAVYLVRLDQLLASMGIDTLLDLGITHGSSNELDCHNQGRAIDLGGVRGPGKRTFLQSLTQSAATPIDLIVYRDWGKLPEAGVGVYRVPSDNPGYAIWKAIYAFGVAEGADRSCDATPRPEGPPSSIGFASCLITPDHPSPSLHAVHQNHMHMQILRTFGVAEG
jgi:hypothetical protein